MVYDYDEQYPDEIFLSNYPDGCEYIVLLNEQWSRTAVYFAQDENDVVDCLLDNGMLDLQTGRIADTFENSVHIFTANALANRQWLSDERLAEYK